jgi:large subunit ribosomal protein L7e
MAEQPKSGKKDSTKKESTKKEATPKKEKEAAPKKDATPKADKPQKGDKKDETPKGKPKTEGAAKPKTETPAKKTEAKKAAADKPAPKAAAPEKKAEKKPAAEKPKAAPKAEKPKKMSTKEKKPKKEKKAQAPVKALFEKGFAATVPESVMKKRRRDEDLKAKAKAHSLASIKALRARRKVIFKKAQDYSNEYKAQENNEIRRRRQAKNSGNLYIPAEPKVLLAVRMKGIMRTHPKTTKILQLLRLRQLNNAVFIKSNKATLTMLRLVEPYVTYGPPSQKTVSDLIYKRGFGKIDKRRVPLNDNSTIARELSKYGIICIEDLIHEIYTCGPHFKEANNFLWPVKLNSPLGGWTDKGTHFAEGGDSGNREELINQLVARMN